MRYSFARRSGRYGLRIALSVSDLSFARKPKHGLAALFCAFSAKLGARCNNQLHMWARSFGSEQALISMHLPLISRLRTNIARSYFQIVRLLCGQHDHYMSCPCSSHDVPNVT